jgi:UDP-GlcNAc:undecaprenyl-phosphate GlcNAc-1-phosphate transferase
MIWSFGKWFFLMAAILAAAFGKRCILLATRWRLIDRPGHRKSHKKPVPYLGGLALFASVVVTLPALLLAGGVPERPGFSWMSLLSCVVPALFACAIGLWDDIVDIPARYKFLAQAALAFTFSQFAYRFSVFHVPGFPPLALDPAVATVLTSFFILAVVNGFNMIDGSDALCLGVSMTTLLLLSVAAEWQNQPHLVVLALTGAGACLGVLYWNRPPARIYSGDAGSQGLGFLVACLLAALGSGEPGRFFSDIPDATQRQPYHFQFVVALLLAGLPALEVLLTVARRGLQGRSLGRADQGHMHHRLARIGLSPLAIAVAAILSSLLSGGIVLSYLVGDKGLATLLVIPFVALLSLGLQKLGYTRFFQRRWLDDRRPHFAVATHFANMQSAKLKLALNREETLALVAQACHEMGVRECRITLRDESYTFKRWTWTWLDPLPALLPARLENKPSVWDRVRLTNTRNHASWTMDNDEREIELTMNVRVLMVEFMRRALERLVELAPKVATNAERYGFDLHGQRQLVLSVKGFKRRLQDRGKGSGRIGGDFKRPTTP